MTPIAIFSMFVRAFLFGRLALAAENLALRQQLAVLHRSVPRPKLRSRDRFFWVLLRWLWSGWKSALVIVSPDTVVHWHRQGFGLFWRWKSRGKPGRPAIEAEVRDLIRRMSGENPAWGAPRIRAELRLLGHDVAESTVAKHMVRERRPPRPSGAWSAFLRNHAHELASCDFFQVHTLTFDVLYVMVILRHGRRQVVHFAVTQHPTLEWVKQQIREAFPFDTAPRFLLRDNDGIYGKHLGVWLKTVMGIEELRIAPRCPWQSPYVERMVGTLRRELFDHVIVVNERHLRRLMSSYLDYYHGSRPHQGLGQDSPFMRAIERPECGRVIAVPEVGGLHRRYTRVA